MRIRILSLLLPLLLFVGISQAQNSGSCTPQKYISAATTNATSVTSTSSALAILSVSNTNAAARWLKIYDKSSAPTVGTDVPKYTFFLAPTSGQLTIQTDAGGSKFVNGIAFAITGLVADSDTTAIAANDVVVNICTK